MNYCYCAGFCDCQDEVTNSCVACCDSALQNKAFDKAVVMTSFNKAKLQAQINKMHCYQL